MKTNTKILRICIWMNISNPSGVYNRILIIMHRTRHIKLNLFMITFLHVPRTNWMESRFDLKPDRNNVQHFMFIAAALCVSFFANWNKTKRKKNHAENEMFNFHKCFYILLPSISFSRCLLYCGVAFFFFCLSRSQPNNRQIVDDRRTSGRSSCIDVA